jgi:hypothetical protein
MSKYLIELAEREIEKSFGDRVSVYDKAKTLLKFGRNADLGTSLETVWSYGGDETYVTGNDITHVSSSSTSDTATVMYVEGHTVTGTGADAKFYFRATTVTLNGQNKVALPYGFARVSRAYVQSGTLAGDFYVFEDDTLTAGVPDTAANVHITVQGASGETQSFKAATTFSNNDYAIITGGYVGIDKKQAASADFVMEIRQVGGVFRPAGGRVSLNSAGQSTAQIQFTPYVIAPKNSDIRIRAVSSAAGTEVDASFQCFLAKVKG